MGVYVQKQVDVYGEGYGVRFRPCEGGDLCLLVMIKEDGREEGDGIMLNWDVAHVLGQQMAKLASGDDK